jgi:hypothetical protein
MRHSISVAKNNLLKNLRKSTDVELGLKVLFPKVCVDSIYDERDIVGLLKLIYSMLPQLVP